MAISEAEAREENVRSLRAIAISQQVLSYTHYCEFTGSNFPFPILDPYPQEATEASVVSIDFSGMGG